MSLPRICLGFLVVCVSSQALGAQTGGFGSFDDPSAAQSGATGQTGGAGEAGVADINFTELGGGGFGNFDGSFGASSITNSLISGGAFSQGLARSNAAFGLSGLGGGFGLGGFGGGGQGGFNNQNQNNEPAVRAVVRLGFSYPGIAAPVLNQQLNDRLTRMPLPGDLRERISGDAVRVEMEGRTAVLRGEVNSSSDGELIARLLALEPGVDEIRNELVSANTTLDAAGSLPPLAPVPVP